MNKGKNKKKYLILLVGVVLYTILVGVLVWNRDRFVRVVQEAPVVSDMLETQQQPLIDPERKFSVFDNTVEYAALGQNGRYVASEDVEIRDTDKEDIMIKYALPELERMSEEDSKKITHNLQALKRTEALGINTKEIFTPEYNWKEEYNTSLKVIEDSIAFEETVDFNGTRASELNVFLRNCREQTVNIAVKEIILDETINVPANVSLVGHDTTLKGDADLMYAMKLEDVNNVSISDMEFSGGYRFGIYIINSRNILVWNNQITNAGTKALCVMGENEYIHVVNNTATDNMDGAFLFNGDISHCIIQGNSIYQNMGAGNMSAGIVLSGIPVQNLYDTNNPEADAYLYEVLDAPHDIVIKNNLVQGNHSSGIYSYAGYKNYIIDNSIEDNEKEGLCLDYGTIGTYVANNNIYRNGNRDRQTDEDLVRDFIVEIGRMEDGTSKAKLPGMSLDNAAYNIVMANNVSYNYGSGIKMVRSGYRNLLFGNIIKDNNAGGNDFCHGYGIELGYASKPDVPFKGLDFTADYENIIARNTISGFHYSGIFLAEEDYCNDLIDNIVMDGTEFAIENHSTYFNSAVGNTVNRNNLDFDNY